MAALAVFALRGREPRISFERVWIDRFWIARYEVSNREFLRFVEENPQWRRDRAPKELRDEDYLVHWLSPDRVPPGLADHPVTRVSWFAARAFCEWAGGELPTVEEWKTAAHASASVYPWGPDLSGPARLNYCDVACRGSTAAPIPEPPSGMTASRARRR